MCMFTLGVIDPALRSYRCCVELARNTVLSTGMGKNECVGDRGGLILKNPNSTLRASALLSSLGQSVQQRFDQGS